MTSLVRRKMCFGTSSGRLSQLCHFGPIIAIFLICFITYSGFLCLIQWWPPITLSGQINFIIYLTWPLLIFYNYFNAVFLGPGFVPLNWRPENKEDEKKLQFCKICNSFKAPRSHHCKKCQRCVFKMDHHCPWINTCCGHFNHASFVYFLLSAPLGCSHALIVLAPSLYRALYRNYYIFYRHTQVPLVNLSVYQMIACLFAIGMAFGVVIAVGMLFYVQMKSIVRNRTGIEDWIIKKAKHRREQNNIEEKFVYPYDLGKLENMRQVFNWSGNFRPIGNGFEWNLVDGCDQFTLSLEQIAQKEEKKAHSVRYVAIREYNGAFFPIIHGCKACCCIPISDDPRMPVSINEEIMVTRWQKHWLYGEKVVSKSNNPKIKTKKGWFPSKIVKIHPSSLEKLEQDQFEHEKKE
ncbi:palmitoyltransferase ZDHHC6 isoform X1 [Brachionus plicatilis]|uniref:Palmitoyltransferase n=1 Tax=Brachionus plicatilis TaxID=10195 RepID=A0A3M7T2Y2_BRAPC|nr:palmitoyltransferase ZDHHC6 isoform X1 [Brachionus plicatilis]